MTKKIQTPYSLFGTDKNLESGKGVTIDYPGFSITINRAGGANKKFQRVLSEKMKPHRQRIERGLLDEATGDRILAETYAEAVILGWKDVKDKKGKDLPFTVENCVKLLTDLPELFAAIKADATNAATFREETEQADEKN